MSYHTDSNLFLTKLRVGDLAYQRGHVKVAISHYKAVRNWAEQEGERNFEIIALVKTAICLSATKRLDEAEKLLCNAVTLEVQHLLNSNEAALLHHEFSILLFRLNRIDEGFREEEKALECLRQADSVDSKLLVLVLKQLVVYLSRLGEFSSAEFFIEDAMRLARSSPEMGKASLIYGQLLATQAILRIDQKRFDEARQLYEQAITLIHIHKGEWNPKVADLYRIIAKSLANAGQTDQSAEFLQLALVVDNVNKQKRFKKYYRG
jgi:tetratricopeptide (TPR) repeat protein